MESVVTVALGIAAVYLFFTLLARLPAARLRGKPMPDIAGLTDRNVSAMERAVIYFFQPACHACKSMTPVIDELMQTHDNVFKVDATVRPDLARSFHIMGTPTTVVVNHGVIGEIKVGGLSASRLKALLG
jgi:thioredoxin 1